MGCRLVAVQDLNDRRHASALHALLNIFDAIIEEDDIIETMLLNSGHALHLHFKL